MNLTLLREILSLYGLKETELTIKPLGSGLIHQTYLVTAESKFVLQKINHAIFKNPGAIARNIDRAGTYLSKNYPDYIFLTPLRTQKGESILLLNGVYWRLTPFAENTYSPDLLEKTEQAYEAAKAFGTLMNNLNGIPLVGFSETIKDFHNLSFRYEQFEEAIQNGSLERKKLSKELIQFYKEQNRLVNIFNKLKSENLIPLRVQHHDTKINNVLFDQKSHKAVAVCDLDTLMPGYFLSDLGDMIRTYTSAENEESTKWEAIRIRPEYLNALLAGYLSEMDQSLTATEKEYLLYAGEFMIYMQGLRFLSDFLTGDTYYPIKHPLNNFNRAKNQMLLLQDLQRIKPDFEKTF